MREPHKIKRGTATIIKLFIDVNIDCAAMDKGKSDMVTIVITDAAPKDTAIGTPKNINTINKINKTKLILI